MDLSIEKRQIKNWLEELKKELVVFDLRKSVLPFKQYLFHPEEDIFKWDRKKKKLTSSHCSKRFVVFGLDEEELDALPLLDEIMSKPVEDFFYWQRRNKSILVGLVNGPSVLSGDLVFEKINEKKYRVHVLTEKGRSLIKSKFFKPLGRVRVASTGKQSRLQSLISNGELLSRAVAWSKNHEIWDELSKKCLGCGVCTYVCPLCHCFSIYDRVALDDNKCSRCRYWDACTLPGFAKVAGNHNFHRSLKERYYNWFYHKFVRSYEEFGRSQCVGCGRCSKACPAGISIEDILLEIVKDYETR